jgi:hypothetical protein
MANIVISGDSSGSVTLSAPAVSGTTVLTLPTTSGTLVVTGGAQTIEFADGTVSAPSITNSGDTNTGIYFPAADTIAFTEGGVESMRIDAAGNVGIGATNPNDYASQLVVNGGSANASINIQTNSFEGTYSSALNFGTGGQGAGNQAPYYTQAQIKAVGANNYSANIIFSTQNSGTTNPLAERMRITSAGDVGIGTSSPSQKLDVNGSILVAASQNLYFNNASGFSPRLTNSGSNDALSIFTNNSERMRIDSSGNVLIAKTAVNVAVAGFQAEASGTVGITRDGALCLIVNRNTDDGTLVSFRQANTEEGNISVSGTTVSYNGGHLSRWSQLPDGSKDESIVKGTVMSNLDDMCVWEKDGVVADNEQLNKMKVSDVEGDTNVAGVFVNWTMDEEYGVDDMNVAMTGDMIIRIADGVVVQKGDLLMSAGDGTAKPQGDDIVRSKTVAKVTSNYVTCTYADGSYCVPCVLMAC